MATLHQLMTVEQGAWRDCSLLVSPGDTLLLADQGVDALLLPDCFDLLAPPPEGVHLAALKVDVLARGLESAAGRLSVELLDDEAWVKLIFNHDPVMSWR